MTWKKYTVEQLIDLDMLEAPMDGNHGSIHPKASDYVLTGVPFIMVNDISNGHVDLKNCAFISEKQAATLRKGFAKPGDVLLSHKATIGRTAIVPNDFNTIILTPQITYYRVKKGIDNRFLKYYFDSPNFQSLFNNWAGSGSTRAYLGITAQRKLPIILPELDEQIKIADILSSLDEKIHKNNEINNNLEEQAEALFKSWFIDFDPFNKSMPSNWLNSTIADLGQGLICGKTPSTKNEEYYGSDIPFITIPDMYDKVYAVTTERHLSKLGAKSQYKKSIPKNSICVSCIGTAGLVVLTSEESQTNQQINTIIPQNGISPYYIYLLMKTLSETINKLGQSGSTIVNLNKSQFEKIQVFIPSKSIMKQFDIIVYPLFERILQNQKENINLESIRDTLLPKLMSGDLDVSDIEI